MKKEVIFLFLLILVIPIISAETAFYVPQNSPYSIRFNCQIDDNLCSDTAICNLSIYYFNSTIILKDVTSTNLGNGEFVRNLTINDTKNTGEYKMNIVCYDGGVNNSLPVYYEVNPSGIRSSQERTNTISRSVYFMLIIAVLLFLAFLFISKSVPAKWTYFALSMLFFLISINLIFTSLQDETINPKLETFFESFTSISWIMYWFIGGLLIIIWGVTFINTWIYKNNLENARRFGVA
jgi:hypothetical protein